MYKNRKVDEFKAIYRDVRHALFHGNGLDKSHIISMVNTILRRKRFKMSDCELLTANLFKPCCSKKNKCLKDRTV